MLVVCEESLDILKLAQNKDICWLLCCLVLSAVTTLTCFLCRMTTQRMIPNCLSQHRGQSILLKSCQAPVSVLVILGLVISHQPCHLPPIPPSTHPTTIIIRITSLSHLKDNNDNIWLMFRHSLEINRTG